MREDVKEIYLANKDIYDSIMGFEFDESDENRKYYVYEWFTKNGKTFYIGKGTGKRYNHILKEIEDYENNPKKYKGKDYKLLKDSYGIEHSILMSNLTECEALIMESYYIMEHLLKRKPLLNLVVPCLPDEIEEWWNETRWSKNVLDYYK